MTKREGTNVLDERTLALEARSVVVKTIQDREQDELLQAIISAIEAENPDVTPERVKAAIVSLLNRGRLELTWDGHIRLRSE